MAGLTPMKDLCYDIRGLLLQKTYISFSLYGKHVERPQNLLSLFLLSNRHIEDLLSTEGLWTIFCLYKACSRFFVYRRII